MRDSMHSRHDSTLISTATRPEDAGDQERPDLGLASSIAPVRVTRPIGVRHARIMLHMS